MPKLIHTYTIDKDSPNALISKQIELYDEDINNIEMNPESILTGYRIADSYFVKYSEKFDFNFKMRYEDGIFFGCSLKIGEDTFEEKKKLEGAYLHNFIEAVIPDVINDFRSIERGCILNLKEDLKEKLVQRIVAEKGIIFCSIPIQVRGFLYSGKKKVCTFEEIMLDPCGMLILRKCSEQINPEKILDVRVKFQLNDCIYEFALAEHKPDEVKFPGVLLDYDTFFFDRVVRFDCIRLSSEDDVNSFAPDWELDSALTPEEKRNKRRTLYQDQKDEMEFFSDFDF